MIQKSLGTFVLISTTLLGLGGCSLLGNLVGESKEDKAAAKHEKGRQGKLDFISKQQAKVEQAATKVEDDDSFKKANRAYGILINRAGLFQDKYCKDAQDDADCTNTEQLRAESIDKRVALWEAALKDPNIEFSMLQGVVLKAHRDDAYAGKLDMKTWIDQLAQQKKAYWIKKLDKRKGAQGWVKSGGKSLCLPFNASTPGDAAKIDAIQYVFGKEGTAWLRCWFPRAPATFKRDEVDYWKVSFYWASHLENIGLSYDVETPSADSTVEFSFPVDMIAEKIEEIKKKRKFKYKGQWLQVVVGYYTRYKTGQVLGDHGVIRDNWKHQEMGSASFFHQFQ